MQRFLQEILTFWWSDGDTTPEGKDDGDTTPEGKDGGDTTPEGKVDGDTTPDEGKEIEDLLTSLGLSQVISEPTNFEPNKKTLLY